MNIGRLVILAGGISSRMRASGETRNGGGTSQDPEAQSKTMIGVGEGSRPFLDYLLFNARAAGYLDVVIVIGERDRPFREHYGSADRGNDFHGIRISFATQLIPEGRTKPPGTADALLRALCERPDWNGAKFAVCNSDNLYSLRAFRLVLESPYENSMIDYDRDGLLFDPVRIQGFAVLHKDAGGRLLDIIEKPSAEQIVQARGPDGRIGVSMNLFGFTYDRIFPFLEEVPLHPVRNEKELPSAVKLMIARHPGSLVAIPLSEHVPDLTRREDIPQVRAYLADQFRRFSWD
jgi:glucose-1-phosphate adenylyltransferase